MSTDEALVRDYIAHVGWPNQEAQVAALAAFDRIIAERDLLLEEHEAAPYRGTPSCYTGAGCDERHGCVCAYAAHAAVEKWRQEHE